MISVPNINEYIIDKNYIYKNISEEIKDLLEENDRLNIVTIPKYVPIAFKVAKELNEEGVALFDEELKVERFSKEGKMKTKIYLSIKRKKDNEHQYVIGQNYFYKNIFEYLKNYLKDHEKVTIVAKNSEVGIAFRVAKELVSQGIAMYDEELKIGRNYKEGKGSTQIFISLKKKHTIKEYIIKKNSESSEIIQDMKKLFAIHEKIKMAALPGDVATAFKAAKKLVEEGIALYDEELKIERNFKLGKGKTKTFISLKKRPEPIPPKINTLIIKKAEKTCEKSNEKEKGKTIEYEISKNTSHQKAIKDIRELIKEKGKIKLVASMDTIGFGFTLAQTLYDEKLITYDEELKISQDFKKGKGKTKAFISLKKKINK